jgi:hypothetical protein
MSTEIIIYSCLSFVSLSLALGYLLKTYESIDDIPIVSVPSSKPDIELNTKEKESSIELVIQQEIIASL